MFIYFTETLGGYTNMANIFSAPVVELVELNNLFIELTAKNCNQRCKHCYIDFPISKNTKDFISIDKVKAALFDTMHENIQCIYLTGAEPMTHPDFNSILRLCLKRASVCICTNATFINEKKARFLKKVEEESSHAIVFKFSIDHYNEIKNDDIRGRGAYRQAINAIKSIAKYNFTPILNIVNYYNEDEKTLISEFRNICKKIGLDSNDCNFQINEHHNKYKPTIVKSERSNENTDCRDGRVLTDRGVYVCPFLANDHRGRMGGDFKDYSKKMYLETDFCSTCAQNKAKIFGLNY